MSKIQTTVASRVANYLKRVVFGPTVRYIFLNLGLSSKFRVLNTNAAAIGHLCVDVDCYLKERELEKITFRGILLAKRSVAANSVLVTLWSRHPGLVVIQNSLACFLLDYLRIYEDTSFDCSKYCATDGRQAEVYMIRSRYLHTKSTVSWQKGLYDDAASLFHRKFSGVDLNRVVAFHSRDSVYDSQTNNNNYFNQNYRNSDLKSYSAILDYLKERGYTVIRLGEYEKRDGAGKYNYLELAGLSSFERDLLNVFISSACSLFLGSASGASDLATIWNRPVFRINVLPYSFLRPHSKKGMAIPKLLKKNDAILSASQIFEANYHWLRDDASYENNGIQIENNDPLDCLPDFIEFFKSFVEEDHLVLAEMAQSFQQKVYEKLCPEDSYDYRAQSFVPRYYFQKYRIV